MCHMAAFVNPPDPGWVHPDTAPGSTGEGSHCEVRRGRALVSPSPPAEGGEGRGEEGLYNSCHPWLSNRDGPPSTPGKSRRGNGSLECLLSPALSSIRWRRGRNRGSVRIRARLERAHLDRPEGRYVRQGWGPQCIKGGNRGRAVPVVFLQTRNSLAVFGN